MQTLWRRRGAVLFGVGTGLLGGLGYLAAAHPVYTAVAKLYVKPVTPLVAGDAGREPERGENYLNTECQVLVSTPVMALALGHPGVMTTRTVLFSPRPIEAMKKNTTAEVGKKDDIITVSFDAPSPDEACKVVDAVVDAYTEFQSHQNRNTADAELLALRQQKEKAEAERKAAQDQMAALRPFDAGETGLAGERRASLAEALKLAQIDTVNTSVAYDEVRGLVADDPAKLNEVMKAAAPTAGADVEKLKGDVFRYQEVLKDLERSYLPEHPLVRSTRARLDQLTVDYVAAARQRYLEAVKRETQLQARYEGESKAVAQQARDAAAYAQLDGDVKRDEGQIDQLATQIRNVTLTRQAHDLTISVLESGHVEAPPKPSRAKTLAAALAAGLVLGAGLAFVREKTSGGGVETDGGANAAAGGALLGVVPFAPALAFGGRPPAAFTEPTGELAAVIKGVVRTLAYVCGADGPPRTILVTSPAAGDGRSTLAAHLAAALAETGRTVCVVDADFRSPAQHRLFNADNRAGLSTVLAAGESLDAVIRPSGVAGLDVLPSGPTLANPGDMLNSAAFTETLADLAGRYDHVLLDAPAVSAGRDARIAAAHCDATILVVASKKATRKLVAQTRDGLASVGANLIGVIANDTPARKSVTPPDAGRLRMAGEDFSESDPVRPAARG